MHIGAQDPILDKALLSLEAGLPIRHGVNAFGIWLHIVNPGVVKFMSSDFCALSTQDTFLLSDNFTIPEGS